MIDRIPTILPHHFTSVSWAEFWAPRCNGWAWWCQPRWPSSAGFYQLTYSAKSSSEAIPHYKFLSLLKTVSPFPGFALPCPRRGLLGSGLCLSPPSQSYDNSLCLRSQFIHTNLSPEGHICHICFFLLSTPHFLATDISNHFLLNYQKANV